MKRLFRMVILVAWLTTTGWLVRYEAYPHLFTKTVAGYQSMAFATAALSTELGATFLDIRQRNPAAIVSGFGGTLNPVLCLAFMLLSIMPFPTIFHVFYRQQGVMPAAQFQQMLRFATVWLIVLTAITTIVPLAIGRYSLSRREY
tara:strand:- start:927 stop:1361 length:435 start_codon:yes stop_codon:yes gene_type:complete